VPLDAGDGPTTPALGSRLAPLLRGEYSAQHIGGDIMRYRLIGPGLVLALLLAACSQPTPAGTPGQPSPTSAQQGYPVSPPQPTVPAAGYPAVTPAAPEATSPPTAYPGEEPTLTATATITPTSTLTPTVSGAVAGPTQTAEPFFITYSDFAVAPSPATIRAGTQVVFLIRDSPHQPYAGQSQPWIFEAPSGLAPGQSWAHAFNQPGSYTILCGYHANMSGTLVVTP
jgi:plastocyanin